MLEVNTKSELETSGSDYLVQKKYFPSQCFLTDVPRATIEIISLTKNNVLFKLLITVKAA
jgi:hypothetical protein